MRHSQTRDDSERGHIERGHISREYAARGRTATWLLAVSAALLIVALPLPFAIIAAMAHNVVAVIAWLVVSRPGRRHALAVVVAIAAAVAVLGLVGPAVASHTGGDVTRWLTIDRAAGLMFGGMPLPTARALVIAFAFLQAVHYAIWLGWIPRDAQPRREVVSRDVVPRDVVPHDAAPRGLRPARHARSRAALAVGGATLLVIGAALVDAAWARSTYLALATFHIYLELVVLAAMFAGPTAMFAGRAHRSRA